MLDKEHTILDILSEFLGVYSRSSSGNWVFTCPQCKHPEHLGIKIEGYGVYHCWTCDLHGKNLYWLAKKYGNNDVANRLRSELNIPIHSQQPQEVRKVSSLPLEFKSLSSGHTVLSTPFLKYLYNRGIDNLTIHKYNLGYCIGGDYDYRIVIPSYDAGGKLNYFTGRSIRQTLLPYKNPSADKKSVVIFENYLNYGEPLTIVEGVFDAMKAYWNATPLLGSELSKNNVLTQKLVEHNTPVILGMDNDDVGKLKTIKIAMLLMSYGLSNISVLSPDGCKDLGGMTTQQILKARRTMIKLTADKLLNMQMGL